MSIGCQLGIDPILQGSDAELLEAAGLQLGPGCLEHVGRDRSSPQIERVPQLGCRLSWIECDEPTGAVHHAFESDGVDRFGGHVERIAVVASGDDAVAAVIAVRLQRVAQLGDVVVESLEAGGGRLITPQFLEEAIARYNAAHRQGEDGEQEALLGRRDLNPTPLVEYFEPSKDPDLHRFLLSG